MARTVSFAPLTGTLIRRVGTSCEDAGEDPAGLEQAPAHPGWREDLRLFAVTWAAGFLFFLVFLA